MTPGKQHTTQNPQNPQNATAPLLPSVLFRYMNQSPRKLFRNPQSLQAASQVYFSQTLPAGPSVLSPDDNHPTPEGLASAMGFAGFTSLRKAISRLTPEQQDDPIIAQSLSTILAACSHMQDYYLKHSLSSSVPHQVAKFISSAYFNINETRVTEETSFTKQDTTVRIILETHEPSSPSEVIEMERLTTILDEQTALELAAMGVDRNIVLKVEDLL